MSEKWFYRVFGEEFGPVTFSDLRESAANGTLSGDDEVRPEALTMWVPAKAVRELQDLYQDAVESASTVTSTMNAAAAVPEATDDWYYRIIDGDGAEIGPLTFDAIIELAKSGRLTSDDEVRFGVDNKWRRGGSMGRLVAVLPYQTRRRKLAPAPLPETQADSLKAMIAALPETDSDESLPEVVSEQPVVERKTPRPKPAPRAELSDDPSSDRENSRPKSRRVDKKSAKAVAAEADDAVSASLAQDIEDQILEELMAPSPQVSTTYVGLPMSMPAASPTNPLPLDSITQDSWATAPRVASTSPSSASSFSRSTPMPSTRPTAKSFKPVRNGPPMSERFKDPKVLGGIGLLALLLLIVGWFKMPESAAADIEAYQTLNSLFLELQDARKGDATGTKVVPVGKKLETTAKEIAAKMKKTANADHPARQSLLWATQTVPIIVKNNLGGGSPSEKEALSHLTNAAVALGLKEASPSTAMVADNNSNEP